MSLHLYPWNPRSYPPISLPALGGSPLGPSDCSENMRRDPPRTAPPVRLHAILGRRKGGWRLVLKLLLEDHGISRETWWNITKLLETNSEKHFCVRARDKRENKVYRMTKSPKESCQSFAVKYLKPHTGRGKLVCFSLKQNYWLGFWTPKSIKTKKSLNISQSSSSEASRIAGCWEFVFVRDFFCDSVRAVRSCWPKTWGFVLLRGWRWCWRSCWIWLIRMVVVVGYFVLPKLSSYSWNLPPNWNSNQFGTNYSSSNQKTITKFSFHVVSPKKTHEILFQCQFHTKKKTWNWVSWVHFTQLLSFTSSLDFPQIPHLSSSSALEANQSAVGGTGGNDPGTWWNSQLGNLNQRISLFFNGLWNI